MVNKKLSLLIVALVVVFVAFVFADHVITIDSPANATNFSTATPNFNFTVTGGNLSYFAELFINGTGRGTVIATNGTTANITTNTSLADGTYFWYVNATNGTFTNQSTPTRTFMIDATQPLVDYTSPTESNATTIARTYIFVNVSVTETNFANITFYLANSSGTQLNATTFTDSTRSVNFTSLSDDRYTYNVSVTDVVNNRNTSVQRTITLDTTTPLIDYVSPTPTNNTNISSTAIFVNVTVTETNFANITFYLTNSSGTVLNTTTFTDSTRSVNFTSLADGRYTYNVSITDLANNRNNTVQRVVTLDTTKPLVDYVAPTEANATTVSRTYIAVNVSVTETDFANITFYLTNSSGTVLNTTTFTDSTRFVNFTSLADGLYTYNVSVTDGANNRNTSVQRTITLDTTGPTVLLVSPQNATFTSNPNLTFTCNATDSTGLANISLFHSITGTFALNQTTTVAGTTNTSTFTVNNTADGGYIWNCKSTDTVNNAAVNNTNFTLTVDTTKPLADFSSPTEANATYKFATAIFVNVSVTETNFANITFYLANSSGTQLNATTFSDTTRSVNFTSLADGLYTYNVSVTDLANNRNTSVQRTITLDTTRPLIDYASPTEANASTVAQSSILINVSITEANFANVTFLVKNSSGTTISTTTYTNSSRFVNVSSLSDDTYVYNVSVTDLVNNRNMTLQRTITLDTTLPVVLLSPANNTFRTVSNVTFTCNASDGPGLVNISLYHNMNGTFLLNQTTNVSGASNSSSYTFVNVSDGRYIWNCKTTDSANTAALNATNYTVTIDTTVPTATASASPTSIIASERVTIGCSATDNLDSSPSTSLTVKKPSSSTFSSATSPYTDTTGEGTYTVRCTATDDAGNSDTNDVTFTVATSGGGGGGGGGSSSSGGGEETTEEEGEELAEAIGEVIKSLAPEDEETPSDIDTDESWEQTGVLAVSDAETGDVYTFTFGDGELQQDHSITIQSVDSLAGTVTLLVQSVPVEITLYIGESKQVDLDGDAVDDLRMTLVGISETGLAELRFEKVGAWAPVEQQRRNMLTLLVVAVVVLLAIIVGSVWYLARRGRAPKKATEHKGPYRHR